MPKHAGPGDSFTWERPKLVFKQLPILNEHIPPPVDRWVSQDDRLHVHIWNSVAGQTVLIQGRQLLTNGDIRQIYERITPNTDRSVSTTSIILLDGYLLTLIATPEASTRRGQCFCQVYLARSPFDESGHMGMLISHYLETGHASAWPDGVIESSIDGRGFIRYIVGADPAAGAEVGENVPTNARWRLLSFRVGLATDAAAVTRDIRVLIRSGTVTTIISPLSPSITASLSRVIDAHSGLGFTETVFDGTDEWRTGLPTDIIMLQGNEVTTLTRNLQAGDNYNTPTLMVEEWIEE